MLSARSVTLLRVVGIRRFADSTSSGSRAELPPSAVTLKSIDDVLEPSKTPTKIKLPNEIQEEAIDLSGVPVGFLRSRRARIYQPVREATQSGWANTKAWKVELDNLERWENPLIGWSSTGDPLSNITMAMDFASKEDAVRYCETNNLNYEWLDGFNFICDTEVSLVLFCGFVPPGPYSSFRRESSSLL
uniref:NADH dehydrogenase [ubiquinone] iron-sulfur protein 4, mitochondrial n=1 Tax=Setaria digitata TaxID=48799 RepID=A0A915Q6B9_9BILA